MTFGDTVIIIVEVMSAFKNCTAIFVLNWNFAFQKIDKISRDTLANPNPLYCGKKCFI